MNKQLAFLTFSLLFSFVTKAQNQYSDKIFLGISPKEMSKTEWIPIQKNQSSFPVIFNVKIDEAIFKVDKNGWKFYKTQIRFGFNAPELKEYFEIPFDFYGAKAFGSRSHAIAYTEGKYFIYAYDLSDKSHINHILFVFDPTTKKTERKILSTDYDFGFYPRFYFEDVSGDSYADSFKREAKEKVSVFTAKVDFSQLQEKKLFLNIWSESEDFEGTVFEDRLSNFKSISDFTMHKKKLVMEIDEWKKVKKEEQSKESHISFNFRKYVFKSLHGTKIPSKIDSKNKIIVHNIENIDDDNSNKNFTGIGIIDALGRDVSSLFLSFYFTNSKKIFDKNNVQFNEVSIRFGFMNEKEYYELPYKFYLPFKDNAEGSTPKLLFYDRKFYIFIKDYNGGDFSYMVTLDENGNLSKDLLFDKEQLKIYPNFNVSEKHGFVLNHFDAETHLEYETYLENNHWISDIKYSNRIDKNIAYSAQQYCQNPLYIAPRVVNYVPHYSPDDKSKLEIGYGFNWIYSTETENLAKYHNDLYVKRGNLEKQNQFSKISFGELKQQKLFHHKFKTEPIIHSEIKRTKVLIPEMPKIHDQGFLPSCEAYALAAILQHSIFAYEKYINDNPIDKNNVPNELDISYLGMQLFTRGTKYLDDEEGERLSLHNGYVNTEGNRLGEDYNDLNFKTGKATFYTNECNNLDKAMLNHHNSLTLDTENEFNWEKFEGHLKVFHEKNKSISKSPKNSIIESELTYLKDIWHFQLSAKNIIMALKEDEFGKFLKKLFFTCDAKKYEFKSYFKFQQENISKLSYTEQKQHIVDILCQGKPISFGHYHENEESKGWHLAVICGYKKVFNPEKNIFVDVFKIHNSWGEDWQNKNGDGWFNADIIVQSLYKDQINIRYIESDNDVNNIADLEDRERVKMLFNDRR